MSIFDNGRAFLAKASEGASEPIEFRPSSGADVTVPARIGRKMFKVYDGDAAVSVNTTRFIVKVADLPRYPTNADTIAWRGRIYKLGCPDGGAPWRFHGSDNSNIAIYANDFGEEL